MAIGKYLSFIVIEEEGQPKLFTSDQLLDDADPLEDLVVQTDWRGKHWGHQVLCVGVRLGDRWHVGDRERS